MAKKIHAGEEGAYDLFNKLSACGKVKQPPDKMFPGIPVTLTGKFGKHWMVECDWK
ncbi:MAG TPA: hypothetical protein VGO58_00430 [Chitinophagaceae bacterium]|nr:hypothetical protein [Chitinophagaceae bacterium]